MSTTEELVSQLASEGRVESEGTFTLDREKAREKMRLFQLPDPRRYVLELVQAATLKGATSIRFDIDADDMRMRFDGRPFSEEDFDRLYGSLFSSSTNQDMSARRELALGLNAAMALNPKWIRVESGNAFLDIRPRRDDQFGPLDTPSTETSIHVRQRFRPGLIVDFFQNISGTIAEERYLRSACTHSMVEIDLEGEIISQGLSLGDARGQIEITAEGLKGIIGHATNEFAQPAKIHIVQNGVSIATHRSKELMPDLVAVVDAPFLKRNVSQTDIVRDEHFDILLDTILNHQLDLLARLAHEAEHQVELERAQKQIHWYLEHVATLAELLGLEERSADKPWLMAIVDLPLFQSVEATSLTLGETLAAFRRRGAFWYSTEASETSEHPELQQVVQLPKGNPGSIWGRKCVDKTADVVRIRSRNRNVKAWKSRPREPSFPSLIQRTKAPIDGPGLRGEVAIALDARDDLHLSLVKEGCLFTQKKLPFSVVGLDVIIEADFEPTELYDDIVYDETYARACNALLDALIPLFDYDRSSMDIDGWMLTAFASFAQTVLHPNGRREALKELGVNEKQAKEALEQTRTPWLLHKLIKSRLRSTGAHFLRYAKLLANWAGPPLSIDDVFQEISRNGRVLVASASAKDDASRRDEIPPELWLEAAREQRAASKRAKKWSVEELATMLQERPIVLLDRQSRRLLQGSVGIPNRLNVTVARDILERASTFLAQETREAKLEIEALFKTTFRESSMHGEVGFVSPPYGGQPRPGRALLLKRGRLLHELTIGIPIHGVVAVVEHEGLKQTKQWDGVVEGPATAEIRAAITRTVSQLIEKFVLFLNERHFHKAIVEAVTAIFPKRAFRDAYRKLLNELGLEEANARYRELLALDVASGRRRLAARLRERLDENAPIDIDELAESLYVSRSAPTWEEQMPGVLSWLDVYFPKQGNEPTSMIDRARAPFDVLRQAKLFTDLNGGRQTLGEVYDRFQAQGFVRFIRHSADVAREDGRVVLDASFEDSYKLLRLLFEPDELIFSFDWLEERRLKRSLESLPQIEKLELDAEEALVSIELSRGDLRALVGLSTLITSGRSRELKSRVCKLDRIVRSDTTSHDLELVALFEDDQLEMTSDWSRVANDPRADHRGELCQEAAPQLAMLLYQHWDELSRKRPNACRRHFLDLIDRSFEVDLFATTSWPEARNALFSIKAIRATDGTLCSLAELRAENAETDARIPYISQRRLREGAVAVDHRVLALGDRERALISRHEILTLRDFAPTWDFLLALSRWKERADKPDSEVFDEGIHSSASALPQVFSGKLTIPDEAMIRGVKTDKHKVSFLRDGYLVEAREVSTHLPCGGWLDNAPILFSGAYDSLANLDLTQWDRQALGRAAIELYRSLAARFANNELDERSRTVAKTYLVEALVSLVQHDKGSTKKWSKLIDELTDLPLFDLATGGAISLADARREKPVELTFLGLWEGRAEEVHASPFTRTLLDGQSRQKRESLPPGDEKPCAEEEKTESRNRKSPRKAACVSHEDVPSGAPEAPEIKEETLTREQRLARKRLLAERRRKARFLRILKEELLLIRGGNELLLSDDHLDQLVLDEAPSKLPLICEPRRFTINLRSSIVKEVLARFEDDPLSMTFLASSVYSAINIELESITDSDEARFHDCLTRHVLAGLGYVDVKHQ